MGKLLSGNAGVWLVSGASRGIGEALVQQMAAKGQTIVTLGRTPVTSGSLKNIDWDLSKPMNEKTAAEIRELAQKKDFKGFIHCAGVLGTFGSDNDLSVKQKKMEDAYRVNVLSCMEVCELLMSNPPNVLMHLSSGAAVKAYQGWDVYCSTKAAILHYFGCLATRVSSDTSLCLSVAPGTVMTDMMKSVLSSDSKVFPDIAKFKQLEASQQLVPPKVAAEKIMRVLESDKQVLKAFHGQLIDVRQFDAKQL